MLLKSLKLSNIRSYTDETIEFPEGSVLLSGDIGSGKSTILLAIEFALFGILRGNLEGSTLLRKGKNDGSVELQFELDSKPILIKRCLKKTKQGVVQSSGYIIENDTKKEATAVELKALMLDMLGYPRSLLTKSKSLVYRFTVYTPQEGMRKILFEDKDARLDTLRKVFGIDKYKRIAENSQVYTKELKDRKKGFQLAVEDLPQKEELRKEKLARLDETEKKLNDILPGIEHIKLEITNKKKDIEDIEQKIKKLNELKAQLQVNETKLSSLVEQSSQCKKNMELAETNILTLTKEIGDKGQSQDQDIAKKIKETQSAIDESEKKIRDITVKISEFNAKKSAAEDVKAKIAKIDKCPLCEQDVSKEHKHSIGEREDKMIAEVTENSSLLSKEEQVHSKSLTESKKQLEELRILESNAGLVKLKLQNLKQKQEELEQQKNNLDTIKKSIGEINTTKLTIQNQIGEFTVSESEYEKQRKELDTMLTREKELEVSKASLLTEKQNLSETMNLLEEEINTKKKAKASLAKTSELLNWFEEHFINLMSTMEKHVMMSIYSGFNETFKEWFNMLIEDETINVRLDDSFTPIIEQNGHETEMQNLSGGEKTSCALAYRLSLNKVINDVISTIKTKDIIILDEPTDGFSTEQLDKLREVLEQLPTRQTIIVSHESKIESFVQSVVRINKNEHVSSVIL